MRGVLRRLLPVLLFGSSPAAETGSGVSQSVLKDEIVNCVDIGRHDLDGDGIQDLACVTRRGDEEPQRAVVVLSSAPAGAPPALDAPILHCPDCGTLPLELRMMVDDNLPEAFEVSESVDTGPISTYEYRFERDGSRFRLANESKSVLDRVNLMIGEIRTHYRNGVGGSVRTVSRSDESETRSAEFLNIYAMPRKGSIKIDGDGREAVWRNAPKLPVGRAEGHFLLQRSIVDTDADLSYSVRALWDDGFLYLLIELIDDAVVLAPPGKNGVRYDHVELWLDRAGPTWDGDLTPRMEPDPEKTFQLGLVPIRGTHKVRVLRWFPDEADLPKVTAAYRKTTPGYMIEARFPLELIGASDNYADALDERRLHKGLVNLTIVASDADDPAEPRQESMLGTSTLEHRGAPFEMGLLHLMKSKGPDDVSGESTASR